MKKERREKKFAKERFNSFNISDLESSDISKKESDEISLRESEIGMINMAKKLAKKKK